MQAIVALGSAADTEPLRIPWESANPEKHYFDLRENPSALSKIEPARQHRPLHTFLSTINSGTSPLASARCSTWSEPAAAAGSSETVKFASQVDLVFTEESWNFDRGLYQALAERTGELLTREGTEGATRAELRLHPCHFGKDPRPGYALAVRVFARGATLEQAELRWGLGLARVQQALLFAARAVRQEHAGLN